jgi:hypothetical protein
MTSHSDISNKKFVEKLGGKFSLLCLWCPNVYTRIWERVCVPTLFDFCRDGWFTGHVSALVQAEGKRGLVSTIWLVIAWIYSFRLDLIEKLLPWFFAGKVIIVFQLVRETDQLIKFPRYVKNVNNKTAGDFIRVSPVAGWFDTFTRLHSS